MNVASLIVELAEKTGLLVTAGLMAVFFSPLRKRLMGVGQRRDKAVALAFGVALSAWGSLLGLEVLGENINVRAIGIFMAAVLGGLKSGMAAGMLGGLFCAVVADPEAGTWVLLASLVDGTVAGWVAKRRPEWFQGWRTFGTPIAIQVLHLALVGFGLIWVGDAGRYLPAWPAHIVKIVGNAGGLALILTVARLLVAREENAIALVEAKRAADRAALSSLRRRLEPHFLFNALNTIRATIRRSPDQARELVSDLADLYRYLLAHPETATLGDEVNHACAYLAIEKARLGDDRLAVTTRVPQQLLNAEIPALLLQPLVENAVRHSIAVHADGGTVEIAAEVVGSNQLEIRVTDHASGHPVPALERGSGIALDTLRERLLREFGDRASISLDVGEQGTVARVRLPTAPRSISEKSAA